MFFGNIVDECNQTIYLKPYGHPWPEFTFQRYLDLYKTFQFTDQSIASPNEEINGWNWSFGDGTYSNYQDPIKFYLFAGDYVVTLNVSDTGGKYASKSYTVTALNWFSDTSFTMSANVQKVSKSISFSSTSSDDGDIVNVTWLFGDGCTGYGNQTSHSYSTSGVYSVTLFVTDNDGATNSSTNSIIIANAYANASLTRDDNSSKNYTTIQKAVDNTSSGGLVFVFDGDYAENLVVDKPLSLFGDENVIITGSTRSGIGKAIDITNNNFYMNGFSIQNSTTGVDLSRKEYNVVVENCSFVNNSKGLRIGNGAFYNIVSGCDFIDNTYGLYITGSNNNSVGLSELSGDASVEGDVGCDCYFNGNYYGIYIEDSDDNIVTGCRVNASNTTLLYTGGIYIDNSMNNTVYSCDVFNAGEYGIYLSGSSFNTIINCVVKNNVKGIYLSSSSNNVIIGNNISGNGLLGVNIMTMSSSFNSVVFNDFINNGDVGFGNPQASDSGDGNIWNTSDNNTFLYDGVGEGNYWCDYGGSDSDGNGIGDTGYKISGAARSVDYYPVMKRYDWFGELI